MTTILETRRLMLRPLSLGDLPALADGLNNFNVSRNTARIPFPYGLADAREFLAITQKSEPGTLRLTIARKDGGGRLCGGIGYEVCQDGRSAEIGYWLAQAEWGLGLGREAARAMTDHAFGMTGHHALVAGYRHGNEASRRILEGLGFLTTGETMTFSRAVGAETPTTRLMLSRHNWETAKGRRQ